MRQKLPLHGRNHKARYNAALGRWRGGEDPIPWEVGLGPAALMGNMLSSFSLPNGFTLFGGYLYLPSREGPPLETGETVVASYAHIDPGEGSFEWLGIRLHLVEGLDAAVYDHLEPWQSDPWFGGQSSGGTGATLTMISASAFNPWAELVGFSGVSDDDADLVHWDQTAILNDDEDFAFDLAGFGHIGYLFHDYGLAGASTANVTVTFASGSGPQKRAGAIRSSYATAVTLGAMVGENDAGSGYRVGATLTDDVPAGSGLIVVTAGMPADTDGSAAGFHPGLMHDRPLVQVAGRRPTSNLQPVYKIGSQLFPFQPYVTGLGAAGGAIDGGGP